MTVERTVDGDVAWYRVVSAGRDGTFGTADDISRIAAEAGKRRQAEILVNTVANTVAVQLKKDGAAPDDYLQQAAHRAMEPLSIRDPWGARCALA